MVRDRVASRSSKRRMSSCRRLLTLQIAVFRNRFNNWSTAPIRRTSGSRSVPAASGKTRRSTGSDSWRLEMRYFALIVLSAALAAGAVVQYTYDDAGRLASVDYGNGRTIVYTYDKSGNLLARVVTGPP